MSDKHKVRAKDCDGAQERKQVEQLWDKEDFNKGRRWEKGRSFETEQRNEALKVCASCALVTSEVKAERSDSYSPEVTPSNNEAVKEQA